MSEDIAKSAASSQVHINFAKSQASQAAQKLAQYSLSQTNAQEAFTSWGEESAWNPLAMARNFQNLEKRAREKMRPNEEQKAEQDEESLNIGLIEKPESVADQFERKNPEMQQKALLLLRSRISKNDSPDEILRKIKEFYPDLSLTDEALDFLLQTTADPVLKEALAKAKEALNSSFGKEIRAGKNIQAQAKEFSAQGLGSPTSLRDLYREVINNPKDAYTLFQEFSSKFSYAKLQSAIQFILHAIGADTKSKGPSIPPGELSNLFTEARNMQAILGVFRFFLTRMPLISSSFERSGLELPSRLNFEILAKVFMRFLQERYPSVDKALLLAQYLGLSEELDAQMILYTQFRDAVRNIAPRLFKDDRQRQDMMLCFIESLEDIEERLEEKEEEQEKAIKEKKKKKEKGNDGPVS